MQHAPRTPAGAVGAEDGYGAAPTPEPQPCPAPYPWGPGRGEGMGDAHDGRTGGEPQHEATLTIERVLLPRRIELPEGWRDRLGHRLHEAEEKTVSMVAPPNRVKVRCLFGKVKHDIMELMQQLHGLVNDFVESSQDVLDEAVTTHATEAELHRRNNASLRAETASLRDAVAAQRTELQLAYHRAAAAEATLQQQQQQHQQAESQPARRRTSSSSSSLSPSASASLTASASPSSSTPPPQPLSEASAVEARRGGGATAAPRIRPRRDSHDSRTSRPPQPPPPPAGSRRRTSSAGSTGSCGSGKPARRLPCAPVDPNVAAHHPALRGGAEGERQHGAAAAAPQPARPSRQRRGSAGKPSPQTVFERLTRGSSPSQRGSGGAAAAAARPHGGTRSPSAAKRHSGGGGGGSSAAPPSSRRSSAAGGGVAEEGDGGGASPGSPFSPEAAAAASGWTACSGAAEWGVGGAAYRGGSALREITSVEPPTPPHPPPPSPPPPPPPSCGSRGGGLQRGGVPHHAPLHAAVEPSAGAADLSYGVSTESDAGGGVPSFPPPGFGGMALQQHHHRAAVPVHGAPAVHPADHPESVSPGRAARQGGRGLPPEHPRVGGPMGVSLKQQQQEVEVEDGAGNPRPLSSERGRTYQHMLDRIRSMYRQM